MSPRLPQLLPDAPVRSVEEYESAGGGRGLARALEAGGDEVIAEVRRSGLRGRGGGGFPTGVKWRGVVDAAEGGVSYLVCNGAEGEPGTWKDRPLMARNPYQLLEGVLIALHAVGAERAYVATKRRFERETARLAAALDELVAAGWSRAEDVELVLGPDEYLFGEEKALLEVIEGRLPLPRLVPPYQVGLWASTSRANPTVVNNVETLSHVPWILAQGADAFRRQGTEECPGTMLFTVSGDVPNSGVFELPMGTPLRTLVCDIGGADAGEVKALYPGVSGAVITPDLLDLPMDFDSFADAGLGLGSGGFVVYDRSRDMVQVTGQLTRFLAVESCGQCNACKLGTLYMSERFDGLVDGRGTPADVRGISARTRDVTDQNRCYLPVGAALVVQSAIEAFPEEFRARAAGTPTAEDVRVPVPKIEDIDEADGAVRLDESYDRKRPDWSYAPEDAAGQERVE